LSASTVSRIRFLNGVSEPEYQRFLDESFALVSASKDEGFGIPLIEAMSRAIPIVVSDIEIFREVSADAGLHFDLENSSGFAEAVKALESADSWRAASRRSLDRSLVFSWNQSASELLKVVRGLTA
jgi:glycosyltransferase involved in cell wall biosynthesis